MSETVLKKREGDLRLRVMYEEYDTEHANPREASNLGVMACFHRRYNLGDSEADERGLVQNAMDRYGRWHIAARYLKAFHGATVVIPLGLIDHSGISMYAGGGAHWQDPGGWDSGTVGLIFDTPRTRDDCGTPPELIEKCLRDEVESYDDYLTGQVFEYVIEKAEKWVRSDPDEDDDPDDSMTTWKTIDSCCGFLGEEYAVQEALQAWENATKGPNHARTYDAIDAAGEQRVLWGTPANINAMCARSGYTLIGEHQD